MVKPSQQLVTKVVDDRTANTMTKAVTKHKNVASYTIRKAVKILYPCPGTFLLCSKILPQCLRFSSSFPLFSKLFWTQALFSWAPLRKEGKTVDKLPVLSTTIVNRHWQKLCLLTTKGRLMFPCLLSILLQAKRFSVDAPLSRSFRSCLKRWEP